MCLKESKYECVCTCTGCGCESCASVHGKKKFTGTRSAEGVCASVAGTVVVWGPGCPNMKSDPNIHHSALRQLFGTLPF